MSRLLQHRGPDDEGFLVASSDVLTLAGGPDTPESVFRHSAPFLPTGRLSLDWQTSTGGVALGHRRLSIVDLTAFGHQPMSYRNRYWIVYNGEVYNYLELREELSALGHCFESSSDTEVILAAYAEWGAACLTRFNGMWGLAILDRVDGTVFLARDRFGVKPLYYRIANNRIVFASEIKAFTTLTDWKAKANRKEFLDFLVWGAVDFTTQTVFEDVSQLAPGHYLLLTVSSIISAGCGISSIQPTRWYHLPTSKRVFADAQEEFRRTLEDAVRLRLRADVPVGSCLSGGLDSSAIVCIMSRLLGGVRGNLETFTSTSPDRQFDESGYAQMVVSSSSAKPHYIDPTPEELFENLDRMVWHQDTPLISGSMIAQWMIFREARAKGVIVMLDGQGADEIICGYRGFFGAYLASLVKARRIGRWLREVKALRRESSFSFIRSLGYTLAYSCPKLVRWLGRFDQRAYSDQTWIADQHRQAFIDDPVRRSGGRPQSVLEMSIAQLTSTNLPMLLHWEDRNSMAFSVEARVPFLDYRVVELCLSLPDELKVGNGISKGILRQSLKDIVPAPVLDRRDKMGFLTSEPVWTKGEYSHILREKLAKAVTVLDGYIDPSIMESFDEMVAGRRAFDHRYWRVISAARWATLFSVEL